MIVALDWASAVVYVALIVAVVIITLALINRPPR